jgi:hypothetical protein
VNYFVMGGRDVIAMSISYRPHIGGSATPHCWCRPTLVDCDCGYGCPSVFLHNQVELRPDVRDRMAIFSVTWR